MDLPIDDLERLSKLIASMDRGFDCTVFVSKIKGRDTESGKLNFSQWKEIKTTVPGSVICLVKESKAVHWAYCLYDDLYICKWGHTGAIGIASLEQQRKFYTSDSVGVFI